MKPNQVIPGRKRVALAIAISFALLPGASASPKFKVLHRFYAGQNNGGGVWGGLTLDGKSNLYGTTWSGGTDGYGTVFEVIPTAKGEWRKKVLHSFDWRTDGEAPLGTLLFDGDTILYGTTSDGGPNGVGGTVFEMTRT